LGKKEEKKRRKKKEKEFQRPWDKSIGSQKKKKKMDQHARLKVLIKPKARGIAGLDFLR